MEEIKPVRRCVCFSVTFAELKMARVRDMEEIEARFGCGTKCGNCRPYLQRMLATGETEFSLLDPVTGAKLA